MTLFDILALGVIFLSTAVSMMRGLIVEITSIITWVLSFVVARIFAPSFADIAFTSMQPRSLAVALSFLILFVAIWILQRLMRSFLTSALSALGLGGVNRLLGAIFGAIKGTFIVTLAVLICSFTSLPDTPAWQEAQTSRIFESLAQLAVLYLPTFMADKLQYPPT